MNRLLQLTDEERKNGVVAWSSGNHAQGVAAAAAQVGCPAVIVMPADTPTIKIVGTRTLGAEIVFYDRYTEDRETIGRRLAEERQAVLVPSYDDPAIIAGQGTAGLELAEQAEEMNLVLDDVLAPVSGGGLIAGVGLAVLSRFPDARLFSVEPESFDDHRRSLAGDSRQRNDPDARSICDALQAPTPGDLTWQINTVQLSDGYAVSDDSVRDAMAYAHHTLGLTLEPGGAIALAAALESRHDCRQRTVGILLTGTNVDRALFESVIEA